MSLLSYPGIDIIRTLKCGICHAEFEAHISVRKKMKSAITVPIPFR